MRVLKFGGSSVGSAEGLRNVEEIVTRQSKPVIVVVSAFGGVTDMLIEIAGLAAKRDGHYKSRFNDLQERHFEAVKEVVPGEDVGRTLLGLEGKFTELEEILLGISLVGELSERTLALVVSYGERLSAIVVHRMLQGSTLVDSLKVIKTKSHFSRHIIDFITTNALLRAKFIAPSDVTVMGGFISTDVSTEEITNLGRGGSDYTAAVVASALEAEELAIYTDVDGFMTSDPRLVKSAYLINSLTFVEAMELCNYGAKIIYPPTIFPAYNKNIPILIKNTFNLQSEGTAITGTDQQPHSIRAACGISYIKDAVLITLRGDSGRVVGKSYRIFKCLAKAGVAVSTVSQEEGKNTISVGLDAKHTIDAVHAIRQEFSQEIALRRIDQPQVREGLSIVAIVGKKIHTISTLAGELLGLLGRGGVPLMSYAQSKTSISFMTESQYLYDSLNIIHDSFFMSDHQEFNLFLYGDSTQLRILEDVINRSGDKIMEQKALKINVVSLCDGSQSGFNTDKGNTSGVEEYISRIKGLNIVNGVFIDCSSDKDLPNYYLSLLDSNISIVSGNYQVGRLSSAEYAELYRTAHERRVKLILESVIQGDISLLSTLQNLRKSGDRITKIRTAISAVKTADLGELNVKKQSEVDRFDVVCRSVVIAREAGFDLEVSDIKVAADLKSSIHTQQRMVTTISSDGGEIKMEDAAETSPFYNIDHGQSVALIHSERYREYPLQLKGYNKEELHTAEDKEQCAQSFFKDIVSIVE